MKIWFVSFLTSCFFISYSCDFGFDNSSTSNFINAISFCIHAWNLSKPFTPISEISEIKQIVSTGDVKSFAKFTIIGARVWTIWWKVLDFFTSWEMIYNIENVRSYWVERRHKKGNNWTRKIEIAWLRGPVANITRNEYHLTLILFLCQAMNLKKRFGFKEILEKK